MPAERFVVVGAGIVGLAVARELAARRPESEIVVLDKEDDVAQHQTGHNSGVAHAGLYYTPGSLKARLCRRGIGLLKAYCLEHGLQYDEIGKVVVARDAAEVGRLTDIQARAEANEVPGLRWLSRGELGELEPAVLGEAALLSPSTAIVDFVAVTRAYADDVRASGGTVRLSFEVDRIGRRGSQVAVVSTQGESVVGDRLVVCAGLQSDRVARLAGDAAEPAIVPFRGEYYRLIPSRRSMVSRLVYPVPDPAYPFLGVHFTPRVDGNVDIGPNAVLALAREGYRRRDLRGRDLLETLRWPGFRRLARQHWRAGVTEMRGSLSKKAFVALAQDYVPSLTVGDVVSAPAGVRAQAVDADGSLVDDFRIGQVGPVVTVRNAPSPAATSSLAIAEHVAGVVLRPR